MDQVAEIVNPHFAHISKGGAANKQLAPSRRKARAATVNFRNIAILTRAVVRAGYVVEKCEEGSPTWEKVPGVVSGTSHTVRDLEPGKKYKFRVKAENMYGTGEPVETDRSVLAKNPFGKLSFPCPGPLPVRFIAMMLTGTWDPRPRPRT